MKTLLFSMLLILAFGCTKEEPKKQEDTRVSASFEYEQVRNAPCWIYFTSSSKNTRSLIWDFGNGFDTYDTYNLKKWYDNSGTYPISLKAYGINGDSVIISKNITVK